MSITVCRLDSKQRAVSLNGDAGVFDQCQKQINPIWPSFHAKSRKWQIIRCFCHSVSCLHGSQQTILRVEQCEDAGFTCAEVSHAGRLRWRGREGGMTGDFSDCALCESPRVHRWWPYSRCPWHCEAFTKPWETELYNTFLRRTKINGVQRNGNRRHCSYQHMTKHHVPGWQLVVFHDYHFSQCHWQQHAWVIIV